MSSTGPVTKTGEKAVRLRLSQETYAQKRIFDSSFEDNKGEDGSNKTISELFQKRNEPVMLEWHHALLVNGFVFCI